MQNDKPTIGVNVFVFKNGKFLLGKRKGAVGEGEWGLPGGKLESGESLMGGARREVVEETGISVEDLELINITNDPRENEHFLQINFITETEEEPELVEPDKFYEWDWFDLEHLPEPVFYGHAKLLEAVERRQILSD